MAEKRTPVWSLVFNTSTGCETVVIGHPDGPHISRYTADMIADVLIKRDKSNLRYCSDKHPSATHFHPLSARQKEILQWNKRKSQLKTTT